MSSIGLLFGVLATNLHVVEKWIKIGIQLHVTTNLHLDFQAHVYVGVNDIHCRYECHLLCRESKGCRSPNVWLVGG